MAIIRLLFGLILGLVVAILTLPFRLLLRRARFSGNVAALPADDPGLQAAKSDAVATVPEFLRRLAAPGTDLESAAVKAPLEVPGGTEHVWITGLRYENGEFVGTVDNVPTQAAKVRAGDTVRVPQSQISDWKLVERGELVGGFTIRYLMSRMPAKQRDAIYAGLPFTIGPEPIPPTA